jgi:hypothetical protein
MNLLIYSLLVATILFGSVIVYTYFDYIQPLWMNLFSKSKKNRKNPL